VELGFANDRIPAKEEDEEAFANFFRSNAGGFGVHSHDKQHAMAYLRIYKGGNNQITKNIRAVFGPTNVSIWKFDLISNLFSKSSMSRARTNTTCIVTAIRDPVDHFLSAYNEVMHRRYVYKNGTVAQFEKFVSDFIGGPVSNQIYRSRMEELEIAHLYSMSGALWGLKKLKECHGKEAPSLTAYLPSLHDLNTEFPKMVQRHCTGLPHFDTFAKEAIHESQSDKYNFRASAKMAWEFEGATSRALCIIHALDYACFDSIPIPTLCQSVYADEEFLEKLLRASSNETGDNTSNACDREFPVV